jgi:hypothetical protein
MCVLSAAGCLFLADSAVLVTRMPGGHRTTSAAPRRPPVRVGVDGELAVAIAFGKAPATAARKAPQHPATTPPTAAPASPAASSTTAAPSLPTAGPAASVPALPSTAAPVVSSPKQGVAPTTPATPPARPAALSTGGAPTSHLGLPLPIQYLRHGTVDQGVDYLAPGGTPL